MNEILTINYESENPTVWLMSATMNGLSVFYAL